MTRSLPPEAAGPARGIAPLDVDELHAEFMRAISAEHPVADAPTTAAFAATVGTGGPRLSASEQLEIYRDQFWLRHSGALAEDYPALERYLGSEWFGRAVVLHVERGGLSQANLTWFGRHFERAVACLPLDLGVLSVAVELARLEWLEVESFHSAPASPLDAAALTSLGPDDYATLGFGFAPSMRLERFEHAVTEIRRRLQDAAMATRPDETVLARPEVERRSTPIVVFRPKWRVLTYEPEEAEFGLLEALSAGASLFDAVGAVCASLGDDSWTGSLSRWFAAWGSRGLVVSVKSRT